MTSRKSSCSCSSNVYQNPSDWLKEPLKQNYNLSLEELKDRLAEKERGKCGVSLDDTVYVYVVTSTRVVCRGNCCEIRQEGCGPNFEGGIITLTNCKHYMRASGNLRGILKNNDKLWIAGVTTRDEKKNPLRKNFLFYLMKVDKSLSAQSFYNLWNRFNQVPNIRNVKNARNNPLGDIYQPLPNVNFNVGNRMWNPNYYYPPAQNHVHYHHCNNNAYQQNPNCWMNCHYAGCGCWVKDIGYIYNGNRPLLLVGENPFIGKKEGSKCFNSYLWTEPKIEFVCSIGRGFQMMSLRDFLRCL